MRHDFVSNVQRELETSIPAHIHTLMPQLADVLQGAMQAVLRTFRQSQGMELGHDSRLGLPLPGFSVALEPNVASGIPQDNADVWDPLLDEIFMSQALDFTGDQPSLLEAVPDQTVLDEMFESMHDQSPGPTREAPQGEHDDLNPG